jgi:hypothetical protein
MKLRENDGTISKLSKVTPWVEGFYVCVREDGSVIIAAPEDLEEDDAVGAE